MSDSISKLFLLLASTETSKTELRAFARWIERHGASHFANTLEEIREFSSFSFGGSTTTSRSSNVEKGGYDLDHRQSATENLVSKIMQLLIVETGLQKIRAANMLTEQLRADMGAQADIPEYNKISFELWLSKLLDRNPQSTVLQVATRVGRSFRRSERQSLDWSLKKD